MKIFKKALLYLLPLVWIIGPISYGQNPYYNKIDKANGLPSNTIYDITQDQQGFMWFATNEGVCKYDGMSFTYLNTKNVTSKAGSSLVVDANNKVYYCNFDGYIYYNKNDVLEPIPQNQPLGFSPIGILGRHLVTTEKNFIVIYDSKSNKIVKKIPFNHNTFVTSTMGDNCYYILSDALYVISSNLRIHKINLPEELKENKEAKLMKYGHGKLYFFNKYRKNYFILKNSSFSKHTLPIGENIIQNIAFVDNTIWLCTTNGILKLKENTVERLFQNHNISYFYKDSFQNYWITTLTEGLFLIPNFDTKLFPFPETITQFETYQNQLIAGTVNNSIYLWDVTSNQTKKIAQDVDNHEIYLLKKIQNHYFLTSSQFRIYDSNFKLLQENKIAVKNIIPIDSKYIGVAASGFCGIFCLDKNLKSEWDNFYNSREKQTKVLNEVRIESNIKAKSMAYNPYNKTIYVSTNLGVLSQTFTTKKTLLYNKKPLYINSLTSYKNVVFGINANGKLMQIDASNTIKPIAITSEEINKLKIIGSNLYVFTKKNILLYSLETQTTSVLLTNNQEFDVSDITESNQQIIFATKKGIISKHIRDVNTDHNQKFILNSVTINEMNYAEFPKTLAYNQNNIKFNFSILNYNPSYSNPISYKINNTNWFTLESTSRKLILNELAPDNYIITFRVFNPYAKKYDQLQYAFAIKPPFWKKPIFIAITLSFLFGICYLILQQYIRTLNRRNKEKIEKINLENELNKSKLTAIKSQMNPHFFFNALNTIQSYILTSDNKKALFYLKKFSVLTRNILEATEKEYISLSDEIKTLELYLEIEKARFNSEEFFFSIHTSNTINIENTKLPAMLLQPYVENAVKHGLLHKDGIKTLQISFTLEASYLVVTIEDNGIGRKKSIALNALKKGKPSSFATQALEKRISILNQNKTLHFKVQYTDKEIDSATSTGTVVTIYIPLPEEESNKN